MDTIWTSNSLTFNRIKTDFKKISYLTSQTRFDDKILLCFIIKWILIKSRNNQQGLIRIHLYFQFSLSRLVLFSGPALVRPGKLFITNKQSIISQDRTFLSSIFLLIFQCWGGATKDFNYFKLWFRRGCELEIYSRFFGSSYCSLVSLREDYRNGTGVFEDNSREEKRMKAIK